MPASVCVCVLARGARDFFFDSSGFRIGAAAPHAGCKESHISRTLHVLRIILMRSTSELTLSNALEHTRTNNKPISDSRFFLVLCGLLEVYLANFTFLRMFLPVSDGLPRKTEVVPYLREVPCLQELQNKGSDVNFGKQS